MQKRSCVVAQQSDPGNCICITPIAIRTPFKGYLNLVLVHETRAILGCFVCLFFLLKLKHFCFFKGLKGHFDIYNLSFFLSLEKAGLSV